MIRALFMVSILLTTLCIAHADEPALQNPLQGNSEPNVPDDIARYMRILECQLSQARGDPTGDAEACLNELGYVPQTAQDWSNQGWSRMQQRRLEEAIGDFDKALQINPEYKKARINKADALGELGQIDAAVKIMLEMLDAAPDEFAELVNACIYLDKWGESEDALPMCQEGAQLFPERPEIHNNLGWVYWGLGNYDSAFEHFNKAVTIEGPTGSAWENQKNLTAALNRADFAATNAEIISMTSDSDPDELVQLAKAVFNSDGEYSLGFRLLQRARELKPNSPSVIFAAAFGHASASDIPATRRTLLQYSDSIGRNLFNEIFKIDKRTVEDLFKKETLEASSVPLLEEKTIFEADVDRVACYLENIQAIDNDGKVPDPIGDLVRAGMLAENTNTEDLPDWLRSAIDQPLPTRFESSIGREVLNRITSQISKTSTFKSYDIGIDEILIGTSEAITPNARRYVTPNDFACDV